MAAGSGLAATGCRACNPSRFVVLKVDDVRVIKEFVIESGFPWEKGKAFYEFTKAELVQTYKEVIARDNTVPGGVLYEGPRLKTLLGFREDESIEALKLRPASFPGMTLFIQSTSVNRVLMPGTEVLLECTEAARLAAGHGPAPASWAATADSSGSSARLIKLLDDRKATAGPSPSWPLPPSVATDGPMGGSSVGPYVTMGGGVAVPPLLAAAAAGTASAAASVREMQSRDTVSAWVPAQVGAWLRSEGLPAEVISAFGEAAIDGDALLELKQQDLREELGLPLGLAKKVMRSLTALKGSLLGAAAELAADGGGAAVGDTDEWEIEMADLEIFEEVGAGAFGKVYRGRWRGAVVAIKQLSMRHLDDAQLRSFKREASIMTRLRHPNVVYLLGVMSRPPTLALITEFCEGGSLEGILRDASVALSDWAKMRFAIGIAAGMSYLSSRGIVHRDLAARNVLITEIGEAKISDFGLSREELLPKNATTSLVGPLKIMSPAALRGSYSEATDVWSFGVLLWEIVFRAEPYAELQPIEVAAGVLAGTLTLAIPATTAPIWAHLIRSTTVFDEGARPGFAAIHSELSKFWDQYEAVREAEEGTESVRRGRRAGGAGSSSSSNNKSKSRSRSSASTATKSRGSPAPASPPVVYQDLGAVSAVAVAAPAAASQQQQTPASAAAASQQQQQRQQPPTRTQPVLQRRPVEDDIDLLAGSSEGEGEGEGEGEEDLDWEPSDDE